ncbi:MAG: hypothetical protein H6698_03270 [Myxococcales bacterium]|nr:hypothetical protein [Myxococcales bacterium]MCB9519329.1 hypothetical protein [Myxococcales bacterium]MCB9530773.1 hypothetical protein [Myxococcales bacterium]MCB9533333.1 hypothetical protein [Myxococcales bacterium]
MRNRLLTLSVVAAALAATPACEFLDPTSDLGDDLDIPDGGIIGGLPVGGYVGPDGRVALGGKVGADCASNAECRPGTECVDGACAATASEPEGAGCVLSAECAEGLACTIPTECFQRTGVNLIECGLAQCAESEERPEGSDCTGFGQCERGTRCNLIGFTGVCEPEGTSDVAEECSSPEDCRDPLLCMPPSLLTGASVPTCQVPAYAGRELFLPDAECEEPAEGTPFQVYFDVPGGDVEHDFYSLPFPNDARLVDGHVDMSGHPNPGVIYIGGAIIDLYLEAAEALDGFSTNPAIYFRFTENPDFGSVVGGGDNPTIAFVNIDPDSPSYGAQVAMRWSITTGRGKFICPRYIAVRPAWSTPLEHGTTYAVYMTNGVRSADGSLASIPADFAAMMSTSAPSSSRLAHAWEAYAPLRSYLDEQGIGRDSIASAAVFTTMDPDRDTPAIRAGVRAQAVPTLEDLTVCGAGVTGPCDDGERGACVSPSGDVVEVHGRLRVPIWQHGERPYLFKEDGGNLVFQGGEAVPSGETEAVCLSMTIPNAPMPEGGWPVVMYAHGTGGDFASHLRDGTATRVSSIDLGDGNPVRMVSISIDGTQHGPRRGDSDLSPETLFYNFLNPLTAVGNVQQGAADYFELTYFVENASLTVPGIDAPVTFDPTQLYYFGHSQGATVGALFAAYERDLHAAVFSGAGGSLVLSLLNKTSPEDIAGAVEFVLTDGGTSSYAVNDMDPLLAILQWVVDPADPLNFARLLSRSPPEGAAPMHIFQSYGYGDTFSPEPNQDTFARAAGLGLATPHSGNLDGYTEVQYPVSANRVVGGVPSTSVIVPANPDGYDGHFVIFRNAELTRESMEFLGTAVRDGVPSITRR